MSYRTSDLRLPRIFLSAPKSAQTASNAGYVEYVVLTEFLVKTLRKRGVICSESFLFYHNF